MEGSKIEDTFRARKFTELFIISVVVCTAPYICVLLYVSGHLATPKASRIYTHYGPTIAVFDLSIHLNTCASNFFELFHLTN